MTNDQPSHNLADGHPGLADARQSPAAWAIARGVMRLLAAHGFAPLTELTLPNGRRADVFALSDKGEIWIVEIKSSLEDYRTDSKWQHYLDFCDRFFFAVGSDFPADIIPQDAGLIIADRFAGEMIRDQQPRKLSASRRRALAARMARAASARLHRLLDPEGALEAPGRF